MKYRIVKFFVAGNFFCGIMATRALWKCDDEGVTTSSCKETKRGSLDATTIGNKTRGGGWGTKFNLKKSLGFC